MATIDTNMSLVMIDPNEPLELYDGTIIKGRLEWFLYALCCLDYGNLPTPLSRIEEWANALITNELPNMEPQSRAEEFFKAILTGDTSNLPTPQSRSEVLLDKLARGENDFTNVEKIQSRYEFLLAYLIKNGGGIGNIDYVLYKFQKEDETLYNTKQRPVKSAILKGQTLVNLLETKKEKYTFNNQQNWIVEDGYLKCNGTNSWHTVTDKFNDMIKPSTKYLLRIEIVENTLGMVLNFDGYGTSIQQSTTFLSFRVNEVGVKSHIVTTTSELDSTKNGLFRLPLNVINAGSLKIRFMAIEYQEGIENWDIPYFEGMQSVKLPVLTTTGKNLINMDNFSTYYNGRITARDVNSITFNAPNAWAGIIVDLSLKPNTEYYLSYDRVDSNTTTIIRHLNDENVPTGETDGGENSFKVITKDNGKIRISIESKIIQNDVTLKNIQLIEGTTPTSYEPFKSNILTTNEEVELRGIGGVKDELNLLTGELTQRIGEFIITNDYSWYSVIENENTISAQTNLPAELHGLFAKNASDSPLMCDKIKYLGDSSDKEHIRFSTPSSTLYSNTLSIWLNKNKLASYDSAGIKQYIQSIEGITVQGKLIAESVKTVDLTITDQGGATIPKLKTFDKITHVNVSATDILPGVEMEVATTIGEDLSGTLYSTMEDIETKQEALKESNNAQTESINSTMMATTEIYESLL